MIENGQPEAGGLPEHIAGPYLRERALQGARFRHTSAEIASVVYYEGGGCSLVTSRGTEQLVPRRFYARPVSVCEIARGRHTTVFSLDLPAADAASCFRTKVTLRWEVTDFQLVAEKRLSSIERDLGPEIVSRLRQVSGRFAVEDAQRANQAILAETEAGRWADLGADAGLLTRMFVEVSTDQIRLDQVAEARKQTAQQEEVARKFAACSRLTTGSAEDRLTYLMAVGGKEDVADVIAMMREDEAQGRRETQEFFLRMLQQGRITSPELEGFLRTRVLASMAPGGFTPPAVPGPAVPAPFVPPPRELPMREPEPPRARVPDPSYAPEPPKAYEPERHEPERHEPERHEPERYEPERYASEAYEPKPYEPKPYEPPVYHPEPYHPEPEPEPYRPAPEPYRPAPYDRPSYDDRRRRRDDDYWDTAAEPPDGGGQSAR
ncbi:hypothetical protein ABZ490_31285 [Streptomyces sp. NPDC005811]|uniref:hypothetical protein n=1 Tax=Streptomyces sp. NPDC005811 TaxID=3154565 RepID=UPI0033F64ED1